MSIIGYFLFFPITVVVWIVKNLADIALWLIIPALYLFAVNCFKKR